MFVQAINFVSEETITIPFLLLLNISLTNIRYLCVSLALVFLPVLLFSLLYLFIFYRPISYNLSIYLPTFLSNSLSTYNLYFYPPLDSFQCLATLPKMYNSDLAIRTHPIRLHSSKDQDKITDLAQDRKRWRGLASLFTDR